ncbi:hypothetical protein MRX96_027584 [Rhipicephalus microplus]
MSTRVEDAERQEHQVHPAEAVPSPLPMPVDMNNEPVAPSQQVPRPAASEPSDPAAADLHVSPEGPKQPEVTSSLSPSTAVSSSPNSTDSPTMRRSVRVRKAPDHFQHADFCK